MRRSTRVLLLLGVAFVAWQLVAFIDMLGDRELITGVGLLGAWAGVVLLLAFGTTYAVKRVISAT